MTFTYDGNEYDIRFEHRMIKSKNNKKLVRKTFCRISKIDPLISKGKNRYQQVAIGETIQHVNDQDVKSVGRKIALGRAIDQFMDSTKYSNQAMAGKMIRKRIWAVYFSECELKTFINLRDYSERMQEIDERLMRYAQ